MNYSYTSSGRVHAALSLSSSPSYIQITGLTRFGTNSWPYSVAIWINPTNISGGTIMHLSNRTDGSPINGWCLLFMGFTSFGMIAITTWNGSNISINGPLMPLLAWTHVVISYSLANGQRLYVNGTLMASVDGYSFLSGDIPMTITLGSSLLGTSLCSAGMIHMGQFHGSLDEFYVYARELTVSEVAALVNV
jgi:hypothetical protein